MHPTHYGRICPIETPEGPNIGLIASLSTFARVNEYGFVETPYRRVSEGAGHRRGVAGTRPSKRRGSTSPRRRPTIDEKGKFRESLVSARLNGDFHMVTPDMIQLMDVAPNQMVSRRRGARSVPRARRREPRAHGREHAAPGGAAHPQPRAARRHGHGGQARARLGRLHARPPRRHRRERRRDAHRRPPGRRQAGDSGHLPADEVPAVEPVDLLQPDADRPRGRAREGGRRPGGRSGTDMGELALGQNVLVAFMPWQGYNFEDSILVSERIAKDDVFTSIHIEEFECVARDTKLGKEEVTRDIPNVGEEALKDLDESGIVRIGAEVKPGDILVGKITPKGETQLSPEEKLLRAIFGEKAGDVRDSCLRVPPGVSGIVINARVFSRKGTEKDERVEGHRGPRARAPREDARRGDQDPPRLVLPPDQEAARRHDDDGQARRRQGQGALAEGRGASTRRRSTRSRASTGRSSRSRAPRRSRRRSRELEEIVTLREEHFRDKIDRLTKGDELPPGVIKMVKVYIAIKRKLQVGDKMAGRHGNKGVISRILPEEDMPYLQDGTPVDIVLNPLGVPSRMNVGQILETHLGWGARVLGAQLQYMLEEKFGADAMREHVKKIFDGDEDIAKWLDKLSTRTTCRQLADKLQQRRPLREPGVRRRARETRSRTRSALAGLPDERSDGALRRPHRRGVRSGGHGGRDVHAQAPPPGRRQDPRALDRAVLARHPAAAGRQGAVRRSASRRDGSVGDGGVRHRVRAPGVPHREERRRAWAARGCTRPSSRASTRSSRACRRASTSSSRSSRRSA